MTTNGRSRVLAAALAAALGLPITAVGDINLGLSYRINIISCRRSSRHHRGIGGVV